jgi:regulator of cell morphogenesis and NO signaling
MNELANKKVGEIVADHFSTAKVMSKYGIDFCCGGGVTLEKACSKKGLNYENVVQEIEELLAQPEDQEFNKMSARELANYIVDVHHKYVETTLPAIRSYLEKLVSVHGHHYTELEEIREIMKQVSDSMTMHMKKEELILFPYIAAMDSAVEKGTPLALPHFGHVDHPIHMMEQEHDQEGIRMKRIEELSKGFQCPPEGCNTYKVAYFLLEEFTQDLHKHIHLENNILFPKAKELFKTLHSNIH